MQLVFQDEMPYNHCWGCGTDNVHGLQLKSHWEGQEAVSTYSPQSPQMAGPEHILNGGIIATIIDCHCINTAIAYEYQLHKRPIGSLPLIWYATVSMKIDYLRPTPIDKLVELRAKVETSTAKKKIIKCTLYSQDQARVQAEVVAVRVPEEWHLYSQES